MWELDDCEVKNKIGAFARRPAIVTWSGQAERDMAATRGVTKLGVLEGLIEHLSCGYAVNADYMKNGDLAYIFDCFVGPRRLYVKVKFISLGSGERMHVFSAHVNR